MVILLNGNPEDFPTIETKLQAEFARAFSADFRKRANGASLGKSG
jgi:hypothetical protein